MKIRGKLVLSFSILVSIILVTFAAITYVTFAGSINEMKDRYFTAKVDSAVAKLEMLVEAARAEQEQGAPRLPQRRDAVAPPPGTSLAPAPDISIVTVDAATPAGRTPLTINVIEVLDAVRSALPPDSAGAVTAAGKVVGTVGKGRGGRDGKAVRAIVATLPQRRLDETTATYRGAGFRVFAASSPSLGWTVSCLVPEEVYSAELIRLKDRLIPVILLIMWVSVWVVLILAYRISNPISILSRATRDIIAFDYTTPLDFAPSSDETGELAESFETMRRKIKDLVMMDHLTGVFNRRFLMQALEAEVARAMRLGLHLSCLLLDIDHFKKVNDTHGHQVGDLVLRQLGKLLHDTVREYDTVARYGGEEFFLILPGTDLQKAYEIAERIRRTVSSLQVEAGERTVTFTVSIGVASVEEFTTTADEFIAFADSALYRAKNGGRNMTVISGRSLSQVSAIAR